MKILCSTGGIIGPQNQRDYRLLENYSKELLCDGFELMMYKAWYEEIDDLISYLKGLRLYIPVVHCEKNIGRCIGTGTAEEIECGFEFFKADCRVAKEISAQKLVLHLWGGIVSDSNFENNLSCYKKFKEIASQYDLDLQIENIVCNVKDPMTRWCQLAERYPDIRFVFDTKMAAFHGQMGLLYQKEYEWLWKNGHICHYHIGDYSSIPMDWANLKSLPIGKGNIDFDSFAVFLKNINYNGFLTLEGTSFNENGEADIALLNKCFEIMRGW
ncbi:MAG: sugar phosphate isomerase/epimerase [Lachnospiraceae bacterium]|nr:sugar phosphate isomerase/epimerase [Lachnospiraceae bacterium]